MYVADAGPRVRCEAELHALQLPPDLGTLIPGQDVAVKMIFVDQGSNQELAEHEEVVLKSLGSKPYVAQFHGSIKSEESDQPGRKHSRRKMRPCANLIIG